MLCITKKGTRGIACIEIQNSCLYFGNKLVLFHACKSFAIDKLSRSEVSLSFWLEVVSSIPLVHRFLMFSVVWNQLYDPRCKVPNPWSFWLAKRNHPIYGFSSSFGCLVPSDPMFYYHKGNGPRVLVQGFNLYITIGDKLKVN